MHRITRYILLKESGEIETSDLSKTMLETLHFKDHESFSTWRTRNRKFHDDWNERLAIGKLSPPEKNKPLSLSKTKKRKNDNDNIPTLNDVYQHIKNIPGHIHYEMFMKMIKRGNGMKEQIKVNSAFIEKFVSLQNEIVSKK